MKYTGVRARSILTRACFRPPPVVAVSLSCCVCCYWRQGALARARPVPTTDRCTRFRPYHVAHFSGTFRARLRTHNELTSHPLKGHVGECGRGRLLAFGRLGLVEWHVDLTGPNCHEAS